MPYTHKGYHYLRLASDLLLLTVCFFLAAFLAKRHMGLAPSLLGLFGDEWFLLVCLVLLWLAGSRILGLYDEFRSRSFSFELLTLLKLILAMTVLSVLFLFLYKQTVLSRFFIGMNLVLQMGMIGSWKFLLRLLLGRLHRRGHNLRHILVVGSDRVARDFLASLNGLPHLGYRIVGFLGERDAEGIDAPYAGPVDDLDAVLGREAVDDVVVASPSRLGRRMKEVIAVCERRLVSLRLIPDFFDTVSPRFSVSMFANFPILSLRAIPLENLPARLLKRSFDLVLALFLFILVFSWLWPVIGLAIKLSSRGPVFFKQERWGMRNRRIRCYKFRSMVAESRDVDEKGRYQQASKNDPRVTRIGRWLRRTNLDELPQFINVLKGEMSVVGPRPHPTPLNLQSLDRIDNYMLRHLVKPGITGWAQVNGLRGETSDPEQMRQRVEHDLWYIENWTFWLDLQILAFTFWQMLRGDPRAY